jgi:hypothetical protein
MPETIHESAREIPVIAETDVVVLGGGPAGIMAACAAARNGAKTLLVERYGFPGGNGAAAMVSNFCGLHILRDGAVQQVVHGLADELLDGMRKRGGLNTVHTIMGRTAAQSFDITAYKLAADELLLGSNVQILFHCFAVGAIMENTRIQALIVESKSGRAAVRAKYFIDCSGDGDLGWFSGAPFEIGNGNGQWQYPTHLFRLHGVDNDRAKRFGLQNINQMLEDANRSGEWHFTRTYGMVFPQTHHGEWRVNLTQIIMPDGASPDGADVFDLTYAELEGRRQIENLFKFLKSKVPGFENSYLLEIAPQIGIRESRRITGQYTLTEADVRNGSRFPDSIGVNGWPMETHVKGTVEWGWVGGQGYHQIPFRCCIPVSIRNLLVAGRCASFTSEALASIRVSGPCFAMGQAAGAAAAINNQKGVDVQQTDIPALQAQLEKDGVFLG